MRKLKVMLCFLVFSLGAIGQTLLSPGDLLLVTVNADGSDNFDFVPLADIASGTVINFTDNAWITAGGALNSNEGILVYTASGSVTKGTVVSYPGSTGGEWASGGGSFNIAAAGDNILVYQGLSSSPDFIYGAGWARATPWVYNSSAATNTSDIPSVLSTQANTIISLGTYDDYQYVTSNGTSGTKSELLALIANSANWTGDNTTAYPALSATFTVNDASLPVTLSLWDGTSKNGEVILNWTTDSEIENLGFIIERALTDKGPWNEIATFSNNDALKGQGSTNNATNYQFTDESVEVGQTYFYRLSDVDYQGVRKTHTVISVVVSGKDQNAIPGSFSLERIYPNPFNPSTTVSFTVNEATDIAVNLFDVNGRLVSRLTNNRYESGNYNVRWNGLTRDGQPAPSGIYLVQISNNQSSLTRKVVLAR